LLTSCWLTLRNIRKGARRIESGGWMVNYTYMLEGSLLGFMVTGAFLPRAYFDFYFQLVAIIVLLKILYRREIALAVHRTEQELEPALAEAVAS